MSQPTRSESWLCDWCFSINSKSGIYCLRCGRDIEFHPHRYRKGVRQDEGHSVLSADDPVAVCPS